MSEFQLYLSLGFDHISDINAYDHILFIVALCAIYQLKDWRKIAVLVTAFTVGHSLTLALSVLNIVTIPSAIIEFLIPVTIFLTCIFNVLPRNNEESLTTQGLQKVLRIKYLTALFFGFIHGMGFSNYLKQLLGEEESLLQPLFAFNLGLELGQLLIVAIILLFAYVGLNILKIKHREWNLFVSGAAAGISLILMLETFIWF